MTGTNRINWAIHVPQSSVEHVVNLKAVPRLLVLERSNSLWVRGKAANDETMSALEQQLKCIPAAQRFFVLSDNQLVPMGLSVPTGMLPDGDWQNFDSWLQIKLPSTTLVGKNDSQAPIKIVRGVSRHTDSAQRPSLLLCEIDAWCSWATSASKVRLSKLLFACDSNERVAVLTTESTFPLPAIPGRLFMKNANVFIPAGWSWRPEVSIETLAQIYGGNSNDLVIVSDDGTWQIIARENMVVATRSAARLSAEAST